MANETEQEEIECKASNMKQMARKRSRPNVDAVIEEFVAKVKMGPDYVCTCCHRMMYKHTVVLFKPDMYSKASPELLEFLEKVSEHTYVSFDGKQWICKTCDGSLSRGVLPVQAKAMVWS